MTSQIQQEPYGYEASLDLGVAALENGLSAAALPYLERAAELRPTRFVLVQLAKAQRDQGRSADARETLLRARERPDGEDTYVLVSLAASLCDLNEHGAAFEVAREAVKLNPQDSAALSILARTMNEALGALAKHDHIDQEAIRLARMEALQVAERAKDARPDEAGALRGRRQRRAQAHWSPVVQVERWAPLDQDPARTLAEPPRMLGGVSATEPHGDEVSSGSGGEVARASWWRRALNVLGLGR